MSGKEFGLKLLKGLIMYQDISYIKKHQVKVNFDDHLYAALESHVAQSGMQEATFIRKATEAYISKQLWRYENFKKLERFLEEAEKPQKAA